MRVLTIENLKRSFTQGGKTIEVLKGIDLYLNKGELVALVGASGSGKSTLLQIAGLLDHPSDGKIIINDRNLSDANDRDRTHARKSDLGFVYQFHHLLPDFTAIENVMLALDIAGLPRKDGMERAENILVKMGLKDRLDHIPAELSGGEQQRVAISRAIVTKPSLLLADEPTGNLDEITAAKVFEAFVDLVREEGLTALIATHDMSLADKMDRRLILREGNLVI
ncbi:ABC transporter ATP-binding protein [Kordiimonas sp. SCSIO 12610]|uniref:ABC transporter ATP-binding protein n=1 Tax=Kordiimonas sp. SCSIO 12610 TaxID=2829597 RepID=UPI00210A2901|nr:ABC transporter ATP-binding protein [Kordiimonas sp. SCSIO 12610]UTW54059.1 ABC transporter ATP-binding protein [Kordiimonas sp. SCSIO 12610]